MGESRILLAILPAIALAACGQSGGNKAGNSASGANGSAQANGANAAAPAAAPAASGSNSAAASASGPTRPVMMGGDEGIDLCPGTAQVMAGRTAVIRSAPEAGATALDTLPAGTRMRICDSEMMAGSPADYAGVIYERPGDGAGACNLGRPSAERIPVPAGCRSGWVMFGEDVEQIGG